MKTKIPLPLGDGTKADVIHFEYNGQPVLTSKQLAILFRCNFVTIRSSYNKHKNEYVKNTDFFKLERQELSDYRAFVRRNICSQSNLRGDCSQSNLLGNVEILLDEVIELLKGPSLIFWTKSGVFKLSRRITVVGAKLMFAALALGYFNNGNVENSNSTPPIQPPLLSEYSQGTDVNVISNVTTNESSLTDFSSREKLELLNKYIELTEDQNLKEKLIREAAKLILGKDF